MSEHIFALLVHEHPEPFVTLQQTLEGLAVETFSVSTCQEAMDFISYCKPPIIFTESALADGSWMSLLCKAEEESVPLSVIVVGAFPDTRHYMSVMELGAFDFVAPPFEREPLEFVTRSAALHAHHRREVKKLAAPCWQSAMEIQKPNLKSAK